MDHQTPDRRVQQRCAKDVSMTCSHLNKSDEHMVTIRNFNDKGLYFESDEALLVDSFIVLRALGAHEMANFGSRPEHPFQFSIENSDPGPAGGIVLTRLPGLSAARKWTPTQAVSELVRNR